ncbi:MAG: hypothetical protein HUU02_15660 [Bacteroidetes bacterium]|nr:hypothetical protein [Bacteroidota bacterium]
MSQRTEDKEAAELRSLVALMDDEDGMVYATVRERLLSYGPAALGYIHTPEEQTGLAAQRLREVRDLILRSAIKEQIRGIKRLPNGDVDLEEGVFVLARYRYWDIDPVLYTEQLNTYAAELKGTLSSVTEKSELLRRTIAFFVEEKGFNGNREDYFSDENHHINRVMDTKIGIPITLSVVYLLVGKGINLPIQGIGLPGHFVLRYTPGPGQHVYFDPFNSGRILSTADCEEMVRNLGFNFSDEYLQPVSNRQILERILRNIIVMLEKRQEKERVETVRQFIDTLNSDL